MSGYKVHPVWSFFEKLESDRKRALCKLCGKTLSLGSITPRSQSIHGLLCHLKSYHEDEHALIMTQPRRTVNPVWNFFEKSEADPSRALCKVCGNMFSLGGALPKYQSIGGLKRHLKACHGDKYMMLLSADEHLERPVKRIKQEHPEMDYPEIFKFPNAAESTGQSENVNDLLRLWYANGVPDGDAEGALSTCLLLCMCVNLTAVFQANLG